jgi:hypothetical protein
LNLLQEIRELNTDKEKLNVCNNHLDRECKLLEEKNYNLTTDIKDISEELTHLKLKLNKFKYDWDYESKELEK